MNSIRVVIADDHLLFQEGLKQILELEQELDFEVVAFASSGRELLKVLQLNSVHIVFLDLNMPDMDGLDALAQIRTCNTNLRVIALTMYDDIKIIREVLKAGADAYVLKQYGKEEVMNAVKDVLLGLVYIGKGIQFDSEQLELTEKQIKFEDRFVKKYKLTKREIEILALISQAMNNKEMAKRLFISDQTVGVHRKNIMRKLNVSNTAGLIKVAYDNNLI